MLAFRNTAPQRDEAQGGQVAPVLQIQLVGGNLLADKLAVRHVLVDGADNPVAVGVGEGEARAAVTGVGVPRDVHPVASPLFAVVRGGEKTVHYFFEGMRRIVVEEVLNFL